MPNGVIFDIGRMSVHDGPGVRTVVFFKGCTLACKWCHNPESVSPGPQMMYYKNLCVNCGACTGACGNSAHFFNENGHYFDRVKCVHCGKCVLACPGNALEIKGKTVCVGDIMKTVLLDKPLNVCGGGLTCSGGEPLAQADFLRELLKESVKNGIHTAVDTAGHIGWCEFEKILEFTDLFLYDIKTHREDLHKKATGAENGLIYENLSRLCETGKPIWIRIPLIPGFAGEKDEYEKIIESLPRSKNIIKIEPLAYHNMAENKYRALDMPWIDFSRV